MKREVAYDLAKKHGAQINGPHIETVLIPETDFYRLIDEIEQITLLRAATLCRQHAAEPMIMRVTKITDSPTETACIDCAEIIINEIKKSMSSTL